MLHALRHPVTTFRADWDDFTVGWRVALLAGMTTAGAVGLVLGSLLCAFAIAYWPF